ncbi:hypothetical protein [Agrococcus terreus]|uniref:hypothetical protein n=1 Tax=Agrococcus terreus TaxID=574649 RepID=UPI001667A464|nr:hypothetical protein [Agrococcus terreus]
MDNQLITGLLGAIIGAVALVLGQVFGPVWLDKVRRNRDRHDADYAARKAAIQATQAAVMSAWMARTSSTTSAEELRNTTNELIKGVVSLRVGLSGDDSVSFQNDLVMAVGAAVEAKLPLVWRYTSTQFQRLDELLEEPTNAPGLGREIRASVERFAEAQTPYSGPFEKPAE